jgi:PAS domain S-box-containing protein
MSETTQFLPTVAPRNSGRVERFTIRLMPQLLLDRLLWPERPIAYQLLAGAAATGTAAALAAPFMSGMDRGPAFFIFFPAVLAAALLGRLAGGLFAAALSILAVGIWTAPVQGGAGLVGAIPFLAVYAAVIFMAEALHRVRRQAFAAAFENRESRRMATVLAEREAWLNAVLGGVADGIITIDEHGIIISVNSATTAIFGYEPEEVVGRSVNMLMPEFCRETHDRYIAQHVKSSKVETAVRRRQVEGRRKDGSVFPMDCGVSDVCFGGKQRFVGIVRDITERVSAEQALRASEEFSRTVLESSADCIEVLDSSGRVEYVNGQGLRLLGSGCPAEVKGGRWADMWPENERQAVEDAIAKANTGKTSRFSARLPAAKGTPKCVDVFLAPVRDSEGRIRKLVATARDITEAREAEEQIRLLMHEVNHRSKNLFAVVQAVTRQMGTGDEAKIFARRLGERLAALSQSYDLLVKSEWRGVDMRVLVLSQLGHFKDLIGTRVFVEGPPAQLTPTAAQSLGMALHELATNAAKYGALSGTEGRVRVAWAIALCEEGRYFRVRWAEEGGPEVKDPERAGFGRTVLVRSAKRALGAKVILQFAPSGLVWLLSAEAGNVIEANGKLC